MANGVMSGLGTIEEPYLCEDVYDFCAIGSYNGVSGDELSYVKLVNNLNFSDHPLYRYGISARLFLAPYVSFEGDNKEIRNLIFTNSLTFMSFKYLNNTKFPNFISMQMMSECLNPFVSAIESNCHYGVYISGRLNTKALFVSKTINDCTYNIKGHIVYGIISDNAIFNRTHINVDTWSNNFYTHPALIYNGTFNSSYVTGKHVNQALDNNRYYFFKANSVNLIVNNSYFAVELISPGTNAFLCNAMTVVSPSFIVSELTDNEYPSDLERQLYSLSIAQATSHDYLESIGFPTCLIE